MAFSHHWNQSMDFWYCYTLIWNQDDQYLHQQWYQLAQTYIHSPSWIQVKPISARLPNDTLVWFKSISSIFIFIHAPINIQHLLSKIITDSWQSLTLQQMGEGVDLMSKGHSNSGKGIGITHISFESVWLPGSLMVNPNVILKRYQNALQQINLELDFDTRDTTIYSIQYPDIRALDLEVTAWWISSNAPILQELSMISRTLYMNGAALNAILDS